MKICDSKSFSLCDQCGKQIKKHNMWKHKQTHNTDKSFKCDPCDFATHTKLNLYLHKKSKIHLQNVNSFKTETDFSVKIEPE